MTQPAMTQFTLSEYQTLINKPTQYWNNLFTPAQIATLISKMYSDPMTSLIVKYDASSVKAQRNRPEQFTSIITDIKFNGVSVLYRVKSFLRAQIVMITPTFTKINYDINGYLEFNPTQKSFINKDGKTVIFYEYKAKKHQKEEGFKIVTSIMTSPMEDDE